ncbi:MAG: hypothetical protein Q8928_07260 [Bacteroidota bacterium]|nr:hypothetical protein [Bacteroidota bacterium]
MIKKKQLKKVRILLIGPLPDPKGGVSIHIKRLGELISPYYEVNYVDESSVRKIEYFNLRSKKLFSYLKLIYWADIVHIHSGMLFLRIFHLCLSKLLFKKVIITIHYTFKNHNLFLHKVYLNLCNRVIFVNKETAQLLSLCTATYIKEAFIPQNIANEPVLPQNIQCWIKERKAQGYAIIGANAWRLDLYNNTDLYGLDMCIKLINEIKIQAVKKVAFIFTVSSVPKSDTIFRNYITQIKKLDLENDFLLTEQNVSFVRIIEYSDVVLRPTITDGDALTIREALYMGVPVIASDIVNRPKPTILFKCRNQEDLFAKVNSTLENIIEETRKIRYNITNDYLSFYKNLYNF